MVSDKTLKNNPRLKNRNKSEGTKDERRLIFR